jgi:hypothetical protein
MNAVIPASVVRGMMAKRIEKTLAKPVKPQNTVAPSWPRRTA